MQIRALLKKLRVVQLIKTFSAFYTVGMFFIFFSTTRKYPLIKTRKIYTKLSSPFILKLFRNIRVP